MAEELGLFGRDWGFSIADIRCPVVVWSGRDDPQLPPAAGRAVVGMIPGARQVLVDGGHLAAVDHADAVLGLAVADTARS